LLNQRAENAAYIPAQKATHENTNPTMAIL